MEEENVKNVQTVESENVENVENVEKVEEKSTQETTKSSNNHGGNSIINWIKSHVKLLVAIVAAALVVILACTFIPKLFSSPEKTVKNYISAANKMNLEKMINLMDIKGTLAYSKCYSYFSGFDDSKFEEEYSKIEKDNIDSQKKSLENSFKGLTDSDKEKNYSLKLLRIKEVKESEKCKNLYTITAKVRIQYKDSDGDSQSIANSLTFIVYKNKIVNVDLYKLFSTN